MGSNVFYTLGGDGEPLAWKNEVYDQIKKLYEDTPDLILTSSGASELQNAINSLGNNALLEVRTNAGYDPITIVANKPIRIRAAIGYRPRIVDSRCIRLNNGARDTIISGFRMNSMTNVGGNNNYTGTAITFGEHQTIVNNIIFHNILINATTTGSAIVLSYHWSVSGDVYYNPPQLSELSNNIAFVDCTIFKGCLDGTEGACILVRGSKNLLISNCNIDNNKDVGRGIMLNGFLDAYIEKNIIKNIGGANAEAIKLDEIGTSPFVQTGWIVNNDIDYAIEGIDVDDNVVANVIGNVARQCSEEGISLDDSSQGVFINNTCFDCFDGIRFELGSVGFLANNNCFNNSNSNYRMDNGYSPDTSNKTDFSLYRARGDFREIKFTPEGGLAVRLINNTGAASIKGYVVEPSTAQDKSVILAAVGSYDPIGVFYESGIPNGQPAWIVTSGKAYVHYITGSTRGDLARIMTSTDTTPTNGKALSEPVPTPPTANVHFLEIGHPLESRVGEGLAMTVLHFN